MTSSVGGILALAALSVVVALLVVYVLVWAGVHARPIVENAERPKIRFFQSLILGTDNRTSTSKTMLLVWTLLVVWGLTAMLIAGELVAARSCLAPGGAEALKMCLAAPSDAVGLMQLSWHSVRDSGLDGGYLILLGIPATAAVAAKAITQSKDDDGSNVKTTEPNPSGKPLGNAGARLGQLFSGDDGTTDLGDTQYVLFNALLAAYFTIHMFHPDGRGLPPLPDTLLGLVSVSAAAYVAKKAVSRNQPTISAVYPRTVTATTTELTIVGSNLTWDPLPQDLAKLPANSPPSGTQNPLVQVGGRPARLLRIPAVGRLVVEKPALPVGSDYTVTVINPWQAVTATGYDVTYT